jgi:hypothetical protein
MNPFGDNRTMHGIWPVILVMYNLMLSILIQGPKQDGIDINVFLEPLMEDMQNSGMKGCVCGTSINRSISRYLQSYSFASMMLPRALQYQGRLKGRVAHILFG